MHGRGTEGWRSTTPGQQAFGFCGDGDAQSGLGAYVRLPNLISTGHWKSKAQNRFFLLLIYAICRCANWLDGGHVCKQLYCAESVRGYGAKYIHDGHGTIDKSSDTQYDNAGSSISCETYVRMMVRQVSVVHRRSQKTKTWSKAGSKCGKTLEWPTIYRDIFALHETAQALGGKKHWNCENSLVYSFLGQNAQKSTAFLCFTAAYKSS